MSARKEKVRLTLVRSGAGKKKAVTPDERAHIDERYAAPEPELERGVYHCAGVGNDSYEFQVVDARGRLILRADVHREFATKSFTDRLWRFLHDVDDVPRLHVEGSARQRK